MPGAQETTVAFGVIVIGPQEFGIGAIFMDGGGRTVIFSSLKKFPHGEEEVNLIV